ncbi:hypothetical protein [Vibrio hepatarius]|uniref:hypothetical protein n=1 Tax=Vibrio hepatarius TaxID=171383 RepID=UPI001C09B951|nr:hypothetical protein [Vibrio hepatarius]MBU2897904.1 hypothetical protein [Vibrio hepatarius]
MNHSLKHTLITLFSILAMLMTSYVSSSPVMSVDSMLSQVQTSENAHCQTRFNQSDNISESVNHTRCHTMKSVSAEGMQGPVSIHCRDSNLSVDNCCPSVCSSVLYPLDTFEDLGSLPFSLAPYQSLKIGLTATHITGLLRPPSS